MRYRFIPFQYYNPYFKTGLNKALMESVRENGLPIVFLSGWEEKCVNLGYSQSFEEEVDVEGFEKRDGVFLVRRQGGGGFDGNAEDGDPGGQELGLASLEADGNGQTGGSTEGNGWILIEYYG